MHRSTQLVLLVAAAATLTACGSSATTTSPAATHAAKSGGTHPAGAHAAALTTHHTSLGQVIAGANGRTVYFYGQDHPGIRRSTCTGACASQWPAVTTTSARPKVKGVTGKVGTIPAIGGGRQVTVNGLPVYYFVGDHSAGDVTGQNYDNTWWVVSPSGRKITKSASSSSNASSSGGSGGGYGY